MQQNNSNGPKIPQAKNFTTAITACALKGN